MPTNSTSANSSPSKLILAIVILVIVIAGVFYFINGKDNRTSGERVGDAVDSFSETGSLDSAGKQLESRSPAEKLGDKIEEQTK